MLQPEYAFLLLLRLHDIRPFHPCALFLLQPASANYIINAHPPSAHFSTKIPLSLEFPAT